MLPASEIYSNIRDSIRASSNELFDGKIDQLEIANSAGCLEAYVDRNGTMGLFIPFGEKESSQFRPDLKSRYLTLLHSSRNNKPVAELRLLDVGLEEVFYVFVDSLIEELVNDPEQSVSIAASQLKEWRSLFTPVSNTQLSEEAALGLLGELETLERLLKSDGDTAFYRWTGPDASRHDFQFDDRNIECKASRNLTNVSVKINGDRQLHANESQRLLLHVRRYEASPTGASSLPLVVDRLVRNELIPTSDFLVVLEKMGYSLSGSSPKEAACFVLVDSWTFEVSPAFPRINANSIPDRVKQLSYTIDLDPPQDIPGFVENGSLL